LVVAIERRQLDLRAERGLGDRDRHVGDEVVLDPPEPVVRLNPEMDVNRKPGSAA
jgi:hypothetical protein